MYLNIAILHNKNYMHQLYRFAKITYSLRFKKMQLLFSKKLNNFKIEQIYTKKLLIFISSID